MYLDKRLHLQVEFDNLLVTDPDVDILGSRHVGARLWRAAAAKLERARVAPARLPYF